MIHVIFDFDEHENVGDEETHSHINTHIHIHTHSLSLRDTTRIEYCKDTHSVRQSRGWLRFLISRYVGIPLEESRNLWYRGRFFLTA